MLHVQSPFAAIVVTLKCVASIKFFSLFVKLCCLILKSEAESKQADTIK